MNPWTELQVPESRHAYTAQLADPEHPFDFYWGKNIEGQYAFRFMGNFSSVVSEDAPVMSGIEVLGGVEKDRSHLTLVLESSEDAKIFHFLCNSLIEATENIERGNDPAAARIILTHLERWQNLLKNRGKKHLSLEQQTGLFGELMVLRDIFMANLTPHDAVASWTGPMGDEQDFGYGGNLTEVKTTRSTRDQEIKIASIAQLDTVSGNISLVFQTVGVFEDQPPDSQSLNSLVDEIEDDLRATGTEIANQFGMRLALVGYEKLPEYDKHHFAAVSRRIFSVEGEFPRIGSADLRMGISRASYIVSVDACLPFELGPDEALQRILKGEVKSALHPINVSPDLLVKLDESSMLEFKSTLRVCLSSKKPEKFIEFSILKSVAAFANSSGGKLVIGVSDDKTVIGLEADFQSLSNGDRDVFEQTLSTMMLNAFGEAFSANNLKFEFAEINNHDICIVAVRRSSELQFIKHIEKSGNKSSKLYARVGNSSREILPEKIPEFVATRPA